MYHLEQVAPLVPSLVETFLDSAYLKYESKLKLQLLPKNALISVF